MVILFILSMGIADLNTFLLVTYISSRQRFEHSQGNTPPAQPDNSDIFQSTSAGIALTRSPAQSINQ